MAEWFKAAVLKTVDGETRPGVRIPLPPPVVKFESERPGALPKPFGGAGISADSAHPLRRR
jgi:hypothetical protein